MIKKTLFIIIIVAVFCGIFYYFRYPKKELKDNNTISYENIVTNNEVEIASYELKDIDIDIKDLGNNNYSFEYNDEIYTAIYTEDNWKIIDSYKIKSVSDMEKICQKLIDIHPIHGADMISYRTPEDMAFEWTNHNLAYEFLPEESEWKESAKDVDLNPEDQGKTVDEIYKARTGKDIDINDLLK